ncbi:conjugal transfer protein TraB [Orientia tsutsugamushi]|nr:conjugal transfer protein TraB [Orientia tsutsugamushi]
MENQPKQSLYNNDSDEFSSDLNHNILNSPHDNKTEQAPVVVKPFVNLRRAGSEPKKMLRTMLLAVVLLELSCLLKSL